MKDLRFRVWHVKEKKMYYRGYQKFLHVLLCDDDHGENDGRGKPVKRAYYGDCVFLESAGLVDKQGREVFEGDIVEVEYKTMRFQGVVGPIPDMFGTKKLHPLNDLLKAHGILGNPENLALQVLGNEYENEDLLKIKK